MRIYFVGCFGVCIMELEEKSDGSWLISCWFLKKKYSREIK